MSTLVPATTLAPTTIRCLASVAGGALARRAVLMLVAVPAAFAMLAWDVAVGDARPHERHDFVGVWGYRTTCRTATELMFGFHRRRVEMPYETVHMASVSCRILSRRGASPRWELELACRVLDGSRPTRVLRLRQALVLSRGGMSMDISSLDRATGETRTMNVFYCRRHDEPEIMPRGILEDN